MEGDDSFVSNKRPTAVPTPSVGLFLVLDTMTMSSPHIFPPSPVIREAADYFTSTTHPEVLDIGSCTGRNSLYLAGLGHQVLGITNTFSEAQEAVTRAHAQNLEGSCKFVVADGRKLPLRNTFDVVLVNEVLHLMPEDESAVILKNAQAYTKPGGLNVVSGYIVEQDTLSQYFRPNQLKSYYESPEWEVLAYHEQTPSVRQFNGKELVDSIAKIIARKHETLG